MKKNSIQSKENQHQLKQDLMFRKISKIEAINKDIDLSELVEKVIEEWIDKKENKKII